MRKIRITKRHHQDKWWLEPLPLDARDPDIVRVKQSDRPIEADRHSARSPRPA